jgi:hypothetical protein
LEKSIIITFEQYEYITKTLNKIISTLNNFWTSPSFWIGTVVGLAGVFFSILAFVEAGKAKQAAQEARASLSIKNIETELGIEVSILNGIKSEINYDEMRRIVVELTSKIARIKEVIIKLHLIEQNDLTDIESVISNLSNSLKQVKPDFESSQISNMVYNGMADVVAETSQLLSTIIGKIQAKGLMEAKNAN